MNSLCRMIDDDNLSHAEKAAILKIVVTSKIEELEMEDKTLTDLARENPRWFMEYCIGWLLENELAEEEE